MPNILPCPFCGEIPEIEINTYNLRMNGTHEILSYEIHHHCPRKVEYKIFRQYLNFKSLTEKELVDIWNKRNA